jgi:Lectin C-type domain
MDKVAVLAMGLTAAVALGFACLPDLAVLPLPPPTCGDGVVDLDRGEACDPGEAGPAGANGCTAACAIDCDGGFVDPASNHCYYWTTSATSKDFAEHFCGAPPNGGHVVTFTSIDELTFVAAQSQGPKVHGAPDAASGFTAWSALQLAQPLNTPGTPSYVNDGELGWSRDCPGCWARIDDPDASVFPPRTDGGATGECATWTKATKPSWLTSVCDLGATTRLALCEREPTGDFTRTCAEGTCVTARTTFPKKSYVLVRSPVAADTAEANCKTLSGRLVVFATREEREEVLAAVEGVGITELWVGLARDSTSSPYKWDDGTDVTQHPIAWGNLEPRATGAARAYAIIDRARYDTRALHTDDDPTATRPYLCER